MKRYFLFGVSALVVGTLNLRAADERFDFEGLRYRARQLALRPYAHRPELPANLVQLTYDDYRYIVFNPRQTIWRRDALPYQVQFFHPASSTRIRCKFRK